MQVFFNSDANAGHGQAMSHHLESVVMEALGHYGKRLTRVDAHLSDANGPAKRESDDLHCTLEARVVGLDAIVVTERAGTAHQAIRGAVRKLERAIGSAIGKHDPRHMAPLVGGALDTGGE